MFVSSAQAQSAPGFALSFDGSTNYVAISHTVEVLGAPCLPPTLSIVKDNAPNNARLEWSSAYPDFHLQSMNSLDGQPYNFTNVPTTPVLFYGKFGVTNGTTAPRQYFRLIK